MVNGVMMIRLQLAETPTLFFQMQQLWESFSMIFGEMIYYDEEKEDGLMTAGGRSLR
jgi:hypothetical protein